MTDAELAQAEAYHQQVVSLTAYRDSVANNTDPAVAAMLASTAGFDGLGATIKTHWLADTDAEIATAQATFDAFQGTIV